MAVNGKHHAPNERNRDGTFVRGHVGFGGRKPGSRNKLAESFLSDLQREWARSGRKALELTATTDPVAFTKIVANLLPKEMLASVINVNAKVDVNLLADVNDFSAAYQQWGRAIGVARPPLLEASPEDDLVQDDE